MIRLAELDWPVLQLFLLALIAGCMCFACLQAFSLACLLLDYLVLVRHVAIVSTRY